MVSEWKRLFYSIKGRYMSKPLIRFFYIPFVKLFLIVLYLLRLPVSLVNSFGLVLGLVGSVLILVRPGWIPAVILFFSFVMDIASNAWAKYKEGVSLGQRWLDETSGVIKVFLIFIMGAIASFRLSQDYTILLLSNFAVFSYMMMIYGGALIEYLSFRYDVKEDLTNIIKKSLGKKNRWVIKSPLGFSFEYQWTLIIVLVVFNRFDILFWLFVIFCNLKWIQGYFMSASRK